MIDLQILKENVLVTENELATSCIFQVLSLSIAEMKIWSSETVYQLAIWLCMSDLDHG